MPEPGGRDLFRAESLERLSSPERLDELLRLADRRSWLPLSALGGLVLLALVWAVFGRVPLHVEGRGVLVHPRTVVELQAPGAGRLIELDLRTGQHVRAGDVLGRLALPDVETQLALQRDKAAELEAQSRRAAVLRGERASLEQGSRTLRASLEHQIADLQRLADELKHGRLQSIAEEEQAVEQRVAIARELAQSLEARLPGQRQLHVDGVLSRRDLDLAEQEHMESLTRQFALEADLRRLRTERLEAEERHLDQRERIAELTFQLQDLAVQSKELEQEHLESAGSYDQQVAEVHREIARLEQRRRVEGRIVAEHAGRILELSAAVGQLVEPGDRLGALEAFQPGRRLECLGYFTVRDGKRLKPGTMEIQVTPDTVERRRHGSIRGTVVAVSPLPITLAETVSVVGNTAVAELLTAGGRLIEVRAELQEDAGTPSGYAWTSSRGPELEVSAGTTAAVRVAVERRRPIGFVLPFLREVTGVE
jgi:HlyD family secretion protein